MTVVLCADHMPHMLMIDIHQIRKNFAKNFQETKSRTLPKMSKYTKNISIENIFTEIFSPKILRLIREPKDGI